jgi:hypothetical protein
MGRIPLADKRYNTRSGSCLLAYLADKSDRILSSPSQYTPKSDPLNYLAWDDEYKPQVIVRCGPLRGGIYAISNGLGAD